MGFANLPPETLHLILEYLINAQKSLSSLSTVDRRTYFVCYPLIYQSVTLDSLQAVSAFCRAHILGIRQPTYSPYLTDLNIGSRWRFIIDKSGFRLSRDHALYLRRALENLENLKSLSLAVTSKALTLLLNHLGFPFQLESFVHSGRLSAPLLRFLEGQPRITYLGWHGEASKTDVDSLCKLLESNATMLPNLKVLDGPIQLLGGMLPLRPISNITLTRAGFRGGSESFMEALQRTTTPIARLCICENDPQWHTWMWITRMAQSTCLHSTLTQLCIVELPNITKFEAPYREKSAKLLSSVMTSPAFGALDSFELTSTHGIRWRLPPSYVRSWLVRGGCDPSAWRTHVPSLRTVVIHDIEIVL